MADQPSNAQVLLARFRQLRGLGQQPAPAPAPPQPMGGGGGGQDIFLPPQNIPPQGKVDSRLPMANLPPEIQRRILLEMMQRGGGR